MIYNTTTNQANIYNGTSWGAVGGGAISTASDVTLTSLATNDILKYNGSTWVNTPMSTAMGTTTMVANWPDAIVCNVTNPAWGNIVLYLMHAPYIGNGLYYYRSVYTPNNSVYDVLFNSNGTFNSYNSIVASNCDSKTVTQLYAAGQAFNFIGSGSAVSFTGGSVGAPGLSVNGDSDTGLWAPAANTLAVSTGGSERLRFDSSGNVGIGTASPGNLLHINSGATPSASQLRLQANSLGALSALSYAADNQSIGFDVDYASGGWVARNATVAWLNKQGGSLKIQGSGGNTVGSAATQTELVAVNLTSGNVGIGTTGPQDKLYCCAVLDWNGLNGGHGRNRWRTCCMVHRLRREPGCVGWRNPALGHRQVRYQYADRGNGRHL